MKEKIKLVQRKEEGKKKKEKRKGREAKRKRGGERDGEREGRREEKIRIGILLLQLSLVVIVQSLSHVRLCNPMDCSTPGSSVPPLSPRVCSVSRPLSP